MLFNSFEFLLFLPVTFLLYWFVFKSLRWQNLFLVAASYLFYGCWDYHFLFLIAFTTLFSYASGLLIARYEGNCNMQKAISALNIVLNLTILGFFKYFNFFSENLQVLLHSIGIKTDWVTLEILLPMGISFYTFQALSYSIDVYRKKLEPCRDIVSFFAYISFFPQLVAGPIERATNLLPQFYRSRTFCYAEAVDGCRQMLWGFFKKMVIADNAAFFVQRIFDAPENYHSLSLLVGAIFFSIQIYCDFSGYSDIAIGCAINPPINAIRHHTGAGVGPSCECDAIIGAEAHAHIIVSCFAGFTHCLDVERGVQFHISVIAYPRRKTHLAGVDFFHLINLVEVQFNNTVVAAAGFIPRRFVGKCLFTLVVNHKLCFKRARRIRPHVAVAKNAITGIKILEKCA